MRESCLDAFNSYVARFDVSDERIALKVEHTYEVAELCDEIARGEGLSPADVDLAWLCGLLHDIGRFEQLCQWGTFSDADSCSHAALGVQVLKDEMGSFTGDPDWAHIIERAVALHSDFRLPSGLGARERLFCTITRDADKVDILRVFNQSSCDAVLGIDPSEFSRGDISDVASRRSASAGASRAMSALDRSTAFLAPSASPSSSSCPRPARPWGIGDTCRRSCANPSA